MEPRAPHPSNWSGRRTVRLLGLAGQRPKVRRRAIPLKVELVVEVVVGCWGRAGLALLAQPQACDSSASGKHHKEQWREQGAWLLGGSGPRLFRKAKELGPCSPLPHTHPPPLFALAPAHMDPKGPSCQEKSAPELQTWGPGARLGAQARSQEAPASPAPAQWARLLYYGGSLGLGFPPGSSGTTPPGLAAYHVLARI